MFEILFTIGSAVLFSGIIVPLADLKSKDTSLYQAAFICTCIGSLFLLFFSIGSILSSSYEYSHLACEITSSLNFSFFFDHLSSFFIFIVSLISLPVGIYSIKYVEHITQRCKRSLIASLMNLFIVSMVLVIASANMFGFLFFWEIMALSSFLLVMVEYEKKETEKAAIFYFVMTHLSTVFLFFAFLFIYNQTGSLDIQQFHADPLILSFAFLFLFLGFSIKAGIIPFHKWLPYAHPASPSNISALMSGVMLKVALYGLVRFILLMDMQLWWGTLILIAGTSSAVLGAIYALKEHDLKKMLAYSSIENIGIILIGLGLYAIFTVYALPTIAMLALVGALFHTLNHAIFKGLLFMAAGSIVNSTGTKNIEELGGLIKRMPLTALFFLIGAISISALPPFNGFVSELMLFQVFMQATSIANPYVELLLLVALSIFALTSALAAACFVKAFGITFLALPRSEAAKKAKESPKLMLIGLAFLSTLCILFGVFSYQIFDIIGYSFSLPNMLFVGLLLSGFYIMAWTALHVISKNNERTTETWGCGFNNQNSKMEYSASGFSEPIVTILKSIFRTKKNSEREYFDDTGSIFKSGQAEIRLMKFFEERLYLPVADAVKKVALKVSDIQRGDVDLHIGYAFAAIVMLLIVVWWFA